MMWIGKPSPTPATTTRTGQGQVLDQNSQTAAKEEVADLWEEAEVEHLCLTLESLELAQPAPQLAQEQAPLPGRQTQNLNLKALEEAPLALVVLAWLHRRHQGRAACRSTEHVS